MAAYRSLIAVLCLPTSLATAQTANCLSIPPGEVLNGDIDVVAPCALNGTDINGNVTIFAGGSLRARDILIRGNLDASRGYVVDLAHSEIRGDVRLEELVGDASSIEQTIIGGDVLLKANRAALEILNNDISGTMQAVANSGGVTISGNSFAAGMNCSGNTPPPDGTGNQIGDEEENDEDEEEENEHEDDEEEEEEEEEEEDQDAVDADDEDKGKNGKGKKEKKDKDHDAGQCEDLPPEPTATPSAGIPPAAPPPPARPPTITPTTSVPPSTPPPTAPSVSASPPVPPNPTPATPPPRDTTPPTLTLLGAPRVSLTIDSPYTDAGATATDSTDGDLTSRIVVVNPVNTALLGTFTIAYSVSDLSGNTAVVTRMVTVLPPPAAGGGGGGGVGIEFALALLILVVARSLYLAWKSSTE